MNEHTQFKIDTSGAVWVRLHPGDPADTPVHYSDLSPFQQGAVEAALRGIDVPDGEMPISGVPCVRSARFRDLHASALRRIMADCEAHTTAPDDRTLGAWFWMNRQRGIIAARPPLTISLAEDGLIHLSEVGE